MGKEMSNHDWVKLAASTDQARPVLCAIHVTETVMEGCDSYRVHRAPGTGLAAGLWDVRTGAPVDGTYPNLDNVIPVSPTTHSVGDMEELRAVVAAALAYGKAKRMTVSPVTFTGADGTVVALNAAYLTDMLRGVGPYVTVSVSAPSETKPVRFEMGDRVALLMSIRKPDSSRSKRFDVSECLTVNATAEVAA